MRNLFLGFSALLILGGCAGRGDGELVTVASLLDEMTSFEQVASWPAQPYTCGQVSSHDRRSTEPGMPEWFANNDGFGFIRTDTISGRIEKVLFDEHTPGAITRIWLTTRNPAGTMRFYFDGAEEPGWVVPAYDLMQFGLSSLGRGLQHPHTSYEAGVKGGSTLYLPIPYAKSCRVTLEEPTWMKDMPHYYHFNFRSYSAGTHVETFSIDAVTKYKKQIIAADHLLLKPGEARGKQIAAKQHLAPGDTLVLALPAGERMVTCAEFDVACDGVAYEQTMRGVIFAASFDGKQTVWVPLSDFSGGMGAPAVESWFLSADGHGHIESRWPMPYREQAELKLINVSDTPCDVVLKVRTMASAWNAQRLYFHGSWREECGLAIRRDADACYDWNFTTLHGRGIYRGDVLSLFNHSRAWYGEGDEKIWVDGEQFPSQFGTGVEDYYNSSWAPVIPFHTPFGGASRADLANSQGYNTFSRTRNLDAIPFGESLRFDMEMLAWTDGEVDYATTVFWYGDAEASVLRTSGVAEARRELPARPADPADYRIAGAIEFENLNYVRKSDRLGCDRQNMAGFPEGLWSGQMQMTGFGGGQGDFVEFEIGGLAPGRYTLCIYATKATDYGRMRFSGNGGRTVEFDAYCDRVTDSGPIELKGVVVADGTLTLRAEVAGKNPASPGMMFGLDCLTLTKEK